MAENHHHRMIDRRAFLKAGSIGAAAAVGFGGRVVAQDAPGDIQYRTLGRTGMKVSIVAIGAMRTSEPAVFQAAFDKGVNYVDTARCYMDGANERIVGTALKGYRDKVFVATKCHMVTPQEEIIKSVEESLTSLQTDYVDVLQLHHPSREEMLHADAKAALTKLREQGKVRFFGVTAHSNEAEIVDGVLSDPDKFFDVVLLTYNFRCKDALTQAIERAAKAGIGVVAMKTQAKAGYEAKDLGDISPHQAALKWVLRNPNVHAAIPSMVNLDEVKEDVAVMRMNLQLAGRDHEVLRRYGLATASTYCHRCGECRGTCPAGVDIPTVNRSLMYAEGYGDMPLGRATYAAIPREVSVGACGDCAQCVARCLNGVAVGRQIRKAQTLFT